MGKTKEVVIQPVNIKNFLVGDRKTDGKLSLQPLKFTKLNIFLMTILAFILLGTQMIDRPVVLSEKDLLKQKIEVSKRNLAEIQKNCPTVLEDHQSCQQKLLQCYQTDKQFKSANKEMADAIKECEAVNAENAQMNAKVISDIQKMDQTLAQYN